MPRTKQPMLPTITKRPYIKKKATKPSNQAIMLESLHTIKDLLVKVINGSAPKEVNENGDCGPAMHDYSFTGDQGFYKKNDRGQIDANVVYKTILCQKCGNIMAVVIVDRTPS